jgi:hypothetical protein
MKEYIMASPLDESVKLFVEDVFANETLTQDERKQFILSAMLSLENKIDNGMSRWGMSMRLADLGKDVRQPRKKKREAVGFFGNWAKYHEEKDIEAFDVNDIGC